MTVKDQLIQEIDEAPEFLLEEVLNFFLFLKLRLSQRAKSGDAPEAPQPGRMPAFLQKTQEISQQISREEWATVPNDLSKNLDHYLYGAPKAES
ncbi:MAG: hypothetical protein OHK0037_36800 [Elainellaceae cyanobacterium]